MAVAAKGARRITVDGHALRWWVRLPPCGGCPQDPPWILLSRADREGSVITCYFDWQAVATPAMVATVARNAMAAGWVPGERRGVMYMRADGGVTVDYRAG